MADNVVQASDSIAPLAPLLDDDHFPLPLPPSDGRPAELEETSLFDDGDELDEIEEGGLDGEAGIEGMFGDEISSEEDSTSWIAEGDSGSELSDDEDDIDEEEGWIQGSEPGDDEPHEELGIEDDALASDDGGDEGLGEEITLDLDRLPPLGDSSQQEEDSSDLDVWGMDQAPHGS